MIVQPSRNPRNAVGYIPNDLLVRKVENVPAFSAQFGVSDRVGLGIVPLDPVAFDDQPHVRNCKVRPATTNPKTVQSSDASRSERILHHSLDTAATVTLRHPVVDVSSSVCGIARLHRRAHLRPNLGAFCGVVAPLCFCDLGSCFGMLSGVLVASNVVPLALYPHTVAESPAAILSVDPRFSARFAGTAHGNIVDATQGTQRSVNNTPFFAQRVEGRPLIEVPASQKIAEWLPIAGSDFFAERADVLASSAPLSAEKLLPPLDLTKPPRKGRSAEVASNRNLDSHSRIIPHPHELCTLAPAPVEDADAVVAELRLIYGLG